MAPDFVRAEQAPVPCELVFYFTTKLIAEPATTLAPGGGSWETTIEAGDGLVATSGPGADGAVVSCCALGFPSGTADAALKADVFSWTMETISHSAFHPAFQSARLR